MAQEHASQLRQGPDGAAQGPEHPGVTLHEERLKIGKRVKARETVRLQRRVDTEHVERELPKRVESVEVERVGPDQNDRGKVRTLPDGSVSVPVFEEELVVTRRIVVRERVILRKKTRTETVRVGADLKRERADIGRSPA